MTDEELINTLNTAARTVENIALALLLGLAANRIKELSKEE
jgi:hypothetical protein